jgi:hypothetical protein
MKNPISKLSLFSLLISTSLFAGGNAHNHAALFVGTTLHHGHSYLSVGLDYERILNKSFGVVAVAEGIFADEVATIFALGAAYHPVEALKLAIMPGLESSDGHSKFLTRFNTEYAFHIQQFSVSPSFSIDVFEEGEPAYVPGVAFGMGF